MILSAVVVLCLIAWPSIQGSRQVTLTCGSDPDDVMTRVIPGPPGKRGVAGAKGDVGEKGENVDNSKAIARLERKILRLERQVSQLQNGQREDRKKLKRNENKISQLREETAQLEERLADLEPQDCQEVYAARSTTNGVYNIAINGNSFPVYCDMETAGGGWTVFQKRLTNALDFYQNWSMYKIGFGNINGDFWLGFDNIYDLTRNRSCQLHVDVWTQRNVHRYAMYSNFSIEDESDNYRLRVSGYSGTAGDALTESSSSYLILNNIPFTTKDRDNDRHTIRNCASDNVGGWWFNRCHQSCLNCVGSAFYWKNARVRFSTMKLRCV